jgi:DNA-binding HxlR family transcriptional regulator
MGREYGQECSLAHALDHVGERWSLLIVRELSLGPLRFSALARAVGGAPTDVLTKRLREPSACASSSRAGSSAATSWRRRPTAPPTS